MSRKHRHHHHHRRQGRKRHLGLKISLTVLVLVLVALGAGVYAVYKNVENTFSSAYATEPGTTPIDLSTAKPFTTLVLETADTADQKDCFATVLASTNPKTQQTTFMNFTVDAVLPDQTTMAETYRQGGVAAVLASVKMNLNLPVNKVVKIDMMKMGEVVAATGGISLQNPQAFVAGGYQFKQGSLSLTTNEQVQAYLSQIDANDQEARVTRIQNVSMAIYNNLQKLAKSKQLSSLSNYRNLLYAFGDTAKTDVTFSDFREIALHYNKALLKTSKLNLHTTDSANEKLITTDELNQVKQLFLNSLQ